MRPIPTETTFEAIREAYFAAKADSQDPHDDNLRTILQKSASGSAVVGAALEIRASNFGRGLFATKAIALGQAVYEATRYGLFRTEAQWRRFLELLPSDELRCDAVMWTYVPKWDADLSIVAIDLDEGSLMNHGVLTTSKTTETEADAATSLSSSNSHALYALCPDSTANVSYCGETYCYVATRVIEAGEEILCDYTTFHEDQHSLKWYNETWGEFVGDKCTNTENDRE